MAREALSSVCRSQLTTFTAWWAKIRTVSSRAGLRRALPDALDVLVLGIGGTAIQRRSFRFAA